MLSAVLFVTVLVSLDLGVVPHEYTAFLPSTLCEIQ